MNQVNCGVFVVVDGFISLRDGYIIYTCIVDERETRGGGENMKRGDKIYFGKLNYSWPFRQSGISYFE